MTSRRAHRLARRSRRRARGLRWHDVGLQLAESAPGVATITATTQPPAPVTCSPPGLEHAVSISPIPLPDGCRFVSGGSPTASRVVETPADLASVLDCDDGVTAPAIDLAAVRVIVVTETLSPASAPSEVLDDARARIGRAPVPDGGLHAARDVPLREAPG